MEIHFFSDLKPSSTFYSKVMFVQKLKEQKTIDNSCHVLNADARYFPHILMILYQEIEKSVAPLCLHFGKMVIEIRLKSTIPINPSSIFSS